MGYGETLRMEIAAEGIGVTMVMPGGMMTTHLESSAAARPESIGPSSTTDDDLVAVTSATAPGPTDIATPEHAARNVIAALLEDRPYLVTHGATSPVVRERFDAILDAFAHADD